MSDRGRKRWQEGASAEPEEVLVLCRLFDDLITERLCTLRKQELRTGWECPCDPARATGVRAGSGASEEGETGQGFGKGSAGQEGKAAA